MSKHALILALETSSRVGSVGLALGPDLLGQHTFTGPMRHSAEIFPAIRVLMDRFSKQPPEIDHVYLSIGPGSFTGLRIAVTIAKAVHLAKTVNVVAVDTLDVIAANLPTPTTPQPLNRIGTILDAKRNQFYVAIYQHPARTSPNTTNPFAWQRVPARPLIAAPDFLAEFADPADPIALLGDGLLHHKDKFRSPGTTFLDEQYWSPQAAKVHTLGHQLALEGHFVDPLKLQPTYIRRPQAEENWRQH